MTHMCITVDGKTLLDGELGSKQHLTSPVLRDLTKLKPGSREDPWMTSLAIIMARAALTNTATKVTVQTHTTGWTVAVDTV